MAVSARSSVRIAAYKARASPRILHLAFICPPSRLTDDSSDSHATPASSALVSLLSHVLDTILSTMRSFRSQSQQVALTSKVGTKTRDAKPLPAERGQPRCHNVLHAAHALPRARAWLYASLALYPWPGTRFFAGAALERSRGRGARSVQASALRPSSGARSGTSRPLVSRDDAPTLGREAKNSTRFYDLGLCSTRTSSHLHCSARYSTLRRMLPLLAIYVTVSTPSTLR